VCAYLPRHYATRVAPCVCRACSGRPIKCRRDVWAGRLQGRVSTADLQPAHSGLPQCWVVQQLWAGGTVRQVATVRLQPSASAVDHLSGPATGLVTQRHCTVPLAECRREDQAGPRHQKHHFLLLAVGPYNLGFYLPQGHLSGLGTHCNYPTLSYKRLG
jgi:hypothetical protein